MRVNGLPKMLPIWAFWVAFGAILTRPEMIRHSFSDPHTFVEFARARITMYISYGSGDYINQGRAIRDEVEKVEKKFEQTRTDLPGWAEESWGEVVGPIFYKALFSKEKLLPPTKFLLKFRENIEKLKKMGFSSANPEIMSTIETKFEEFVNLHAELTDKKDEFKEAKMSLKEWAQSIWGDEVGLIWLYGIAYPRNDSLSPQEFAHEFQERINRYIYIEGDTDNLTSETIKILEEKKMEFLIYSDAIYMIEERYEKMKENLIIWAESSLDDLFSPMLFGFWVWQIIYKYYEVMLLNPEVFIKENISNEIMSTLKMKAKELEPLVEELENAKNRLTKYEERMTKYELSHDQAVELTSSDEFCIRMWNFWLPVVIVFILSGIGMYVNHKRDDKTVKEEVGSGGGPKKETNPEEDQQTSCIVCQDRRPDVVLGPCGHQNLCAQCAREWKRKRPVGGGAECGGECPTCRRKIKRIQPLIPL